jgi:hypothetical protein
VWVAKPDETAFELTTFATTITNTVSVTFAGFIYIFGGPP